MTSPIEPLLQERYRAIRAKIHEISLASGIPEAQEAELLAVSKGQANEKILCLHQLGQRRFGENYSQELATKAAALADTAIEWVFIGHLQSNKIRKLVSLASEIQTVASLRHAQQIARCAEEIGKTPYPIYLEVNAGAEAGKSGLAWDEVLLTADAIAKECPALLVRGIMAIPPSTFNDEDCLGVPELYHQLRTLATQVGSGQLSLGMSDDIRIAIQAGSNLVRIGQALMGPRQP